MTLSPIPMTEKEATTIAELERLVGEGANQPQREWVIEIVRKTDSPRIRDAAALAMVDLRIRGTKKILLELLRRSDTEKHRGTLLYALDELKGSLPVSLVVDLLRTENYEGREETLMIVGKGHVTKNKKDLEAALPPLQSLADSTDEYTAAVGERAIEWLGLSKPDGGRQRSHL